MLNETHDPRLQSWVSAANDGRSDFPIQNLPLTVLRRRGSTATARAATAVGDQALDLGHPAVAAALQLDARTAAALARSELNDFMALGAPAWSALRLALSRALRSGTPQQAAMQSALEPALIPLSEVEYSLPARIGDYTDFYTSIHHATNIGRLFRPDSPLMPNYKWVPIGYHGRSSSIRLSGQEFPRPCGQTLPAGASAPVFGPCQRLDIELELGIYIGTGNAQGEPIRLDDAESHVFGICLLNDWSARDIQAWEYQPLGPFLSKNFASTISPWIVTLEALAPYRAVLQRPADDPQPLPYLHSESNRNSGALDIQLEVWIETAAMRQAGTPAHCLARTSYRHAYWTVAQLVAHHTVNGCNLQPGDLFGSGTLSGPTLDQAGALIELTQGGKNPIALPNGESRTFLQDGDTVTLRAHCEGGGAARIGFGECRGTVLPARF